jgi:hypothetical protein
VLWVQIKISAMFVPALEGPLPCHCEKCPLVRLERPFREEGRDRLAPSIKSTGGVLIDRAEQKWILLKQVSRQGYVYGTFAAPRYPHRPVISDS